MNALELLKIVRARWRVALLVFLAVVGAAGALNAYLPEKYTSTASVVIDFRLLDFAYGSTLPGHTLTSYVATQVDIISSLRVTQRVLEELELHAMPGVRERWLEKTGGEGRLTDWLATELQGSLDVYPSRNSNVIYIAYTGTEPDRVATIANAFAEAYIDTNLELRVDPARRFSEWFSGRTQSLRDDLEDARKRLSDYQQQHGIVVLDDNRLGIEVAQLAELSSQLSAAQGQQADSASRLSQSASLDTLPEVMQNSLIQSLKSDLAKLESERDQLAVRLGANHPERVRIETEVSARRTKIATETRRVANSLGTTNRVSESRLNEIKTAIEAQQERVLELRAQRDQIAVLQRDVDHAQNTFDLVTERLAQSNLEKQTQQTNVVVLTPATPASTPSSPKIRRNMAISVVLGSALGIGLVLLLEFFNPRVRSVEDLASSLGVPVLSVIPPASARPPRLRRRNVYS